MKTLHHFIMICSLLLLLPACSPSPTATPLPTTAPAAPGLVLQRGDAARSGTFGFPAMRQLPKIKWKTELGSLYLGTPLLADGVLYSGGSDGALYALDTQTGKLLWSGGDFEVIETAVAIAGDMIIGAGGNNKIRALDRHSGKPIWSFDAGAFVFAPPLIVGNDLYIANHNTLFALDLRSGKPKWQAATGDVPAFVSAPAYADGAVYVSVGPALIAFDSASGEERWRVASASQFWNLALARQLVYAGSSDGYFYAYEQAGGRERWKFKSGFGADEIWSAPAISGNVLYVGSRDRNVYALDADSGEKIWAFETKGDSVGDPVVSDGLVYLSDSNHALPPGTRRLLALEAAGGQPAWTFEINSTLLTTPALEKGSIYITVTGQVIALE